MGRQRYRYHTYQLPTPCIAKYLIVLVDKGKTIEVNYFDSLKEAKRAFGEPEEVNGSDYYDVSIWEWTKYRYKKLCGY